MRVSSESIHQVMMKKDVFITVAQHLQVQSMDLMKQWLIRPLGKLAHNVNRTLSCSHAQLLC